MDKSDDLKQDISYVRNLVSKSDRDKSPAAIYLMWAAICLVGFPLVDFASRYVGLYWMIMGPLGTVMSGILGWRHSAKIGQSNRNLGIRHGQHWIATLVAIFLTVPLGVRGVVEWSAVHLIMLLILALSYFLAGVYLDRPILWVGLLMAASYVALFFISSYEWTIIGVVVALGLAVAGLSKGKQSVEAAA
jgi:hypothetical protein